MNPGSMESTIRDLPESIGLPSSDLNNCLLARHDSALFSALAAEYCALVRLASEESVFSTDRQVFAGIRKLARRAGERDALPQDLVSVHISGLAKIAESVPRPMARLCFRQARLLLVKLMGELALYYREQIVLARESAP